MVVEVPSILLLVNLEFLSILSHLWLNYVNTVFTELPPESIDLKKSNSSLLTCEMKAPSDSEVYWTQKQVQNIEECQISTMNEASPAPGNDTSSIPLCNTTAAVSKTVKEVDKDYSIFHLELQVRK